jgi:phosphatidylinositol glycan class N
MPFLRSKVLNEATFGVSHTRVPTESRPGHVAMIAGLYEDVSAVTTGWKLNPVNFDSVFNQSRHTWSWGSPDILPMFKEGAVPGRIDADTYGSEAEDFTTDAIKLDLWVFDKVKAMFKEAKTNTALDAALREDKIVFFLHLLGLDTTGHGFRPYSKEYLYNIQVVDKGVKEIVEVMEDFYNNDGDTAYVFTADHGMSDWGSHGDGHPDNTRTPLIAWGSGLAKPVKTKKGTIAKGHEDGFSLDWNLDHIQRNDVAQADIAALMSYLIGANFPVNSVGELPLDFVAAGPKTKAKALLTNAREILEMYLVKEEQKGESTINFKPYPEFDGPEKTVKERLQQIEKLIDDETYEVAISECAKLIKTALEGLRYLQTYNWLFLRTLVSVGYIGWMAFGIISIIDLHVLKEPMRRKRSVTSTIAFSSVLVGLFSFLFAQESPLTYYGYSIFPVYFWEDVYSRRGAIAKGSKTLFAKYSTSADKLLLAIQSVAFMALLQALVWSYSNRQVFTVCYALATVWPFFYGSSFVRQNGVVVGTWVVSSLGMSAFTVLPVVKVESLDLM